MRTLDNYVLGGWHAGDAPHRTLTHAVTGEPIAQCSTGGLDFARILEYGRTEGGPALRAMTFAERAALLKTIGKTLGEHLPSFYEIAATYGATKVDGWIDIEGGIGNLFAYASLAKKLPAATFRTDDGPTRLSKEGTFGGRHVIVPLEGVAVQINAYNFPSWGMLEKLSQSLLAGMPALVKPATNTCWLAHRMVEVLHDANVLPAGALQLVCGSAGDMLDHMTCQDVLSFTGSADTANTIKTHAGLVENAVRINAEADSINSALLAPDVEPGTPTFDLFVKEVAKEMTVKAGQKCTAIRRVLVPAGREEAIVDALKGRLAKVAVGDPAVDGVRMGPLVDLDARDQARANVAKLAAEATIVHGDPNRSDFEGGSADTGAFLEPILLHCTDPDAATAVHSIEAFGPVSTVMGYRDLDHACALVRRGGGSLVTSIYTEDDATANTLTFALAPWHGRLMVMSEAAAGESTGHGSAMPQLVHGGPGRAGGGEELGGLRGLAHYTICTALQGAPDRLEGIVAPATGSA